MSDLVQRPSTSGRNKMMTPDYAEVLRLYRKHSRDQKEPLYQAFVHACARIEALEEALRECCTELEYYSRCEWRSAEGGKISKFNTTAIINRARAALAPEQDK